MKLKLMILVLISARTFAAEAKCKHSDVAGKEMLIRIYNAEAYRLVTRPYTENLDELKYDQDGIPNSCDMKNWSVTVKVKGNDEFTATAQSKITKKAFTIDQTKKIKEI